MDGHTHAVWVGDRVHEFAMKVTINYPWAVYWEGPSAFIRGGGGGGRRKNFCEKFFCPDFDAEYNGEIDIWIRLPVLQQNLGKTFRSKIAELDSFRNGLFDFEDVGLILTGIFFARNPQNAKINIWGATFWPPNGAWLYSKEAKNERESFLPWKNFDPSHRIRRKNKKRFCKKLLGLLPAKPL